MKIPIGMVQHNCLVDLLSRCGKVEEAHEYVKNNVQNPDVIMWTTVLSGLFSLKVTSLLWILARRHSIIWCAALKYTGAIWEENEKLIHECAAKIKEINPKDPNLYVVLGQYYLRTGRASEAADLKYFMHNNKIFKMPGVTRFIIGNEVSLTMMILINDRVASQIHGGRWRASRAQFHQAAEYRVTWRNEKSRLDSKYF